MGAEPVRGNRSGVGRSPVGFQVGPPPPLPPPWGAFGMRGTDGDLHGGLRPPHGHPRPPGRPTLQGRRPGPPFVSHDARDPEGASRSLTMPRRWFVFLRPDPDPLLHRCGWGLGTGESHWGWDRRPPLGRRFRFGARFWRRPSPAGGWGGAEMPPPTPPPSSLPLVRHPIALPHYHPSRSGPVRKYFHYHCCCGLSVFNFNQIQKCEIISFLWSVSDFLSRVPPVDQQNIA